MQARVLVPALEVGARHVDLAAHLQHRRPAFAFEPVRDDRDRAQVGGHVLAGGAIAAGRALHEHAALVAQADRQPVQLGLGGEHQVVAIQAFADAADEIGHLLVAEGVAQRQHRHRMGDLREAAGRRRAHLGGRRGRVGEFGMRAFQRLEFAYQRVVVGVGQVRVVDLVVAPVGILDAAAEFGDARGGVGRHGGSDGAAVIPAEAGMTSHYQRVGLLSGGAAFWRS